MDFYVSNDPTNCVETLNEVLKVRLQSHHAGPPHHVTRNTTYTTRMWANAQRDGRPAEQGGALCSTPRSLADAHYLTAVQRCQDAKPVEICSGAPN